MADRGRTVGGALVAHHTAGGRSPASKNECTGAAPVSMDKHHQESME